MTHVLPTDLGNSEKKTSATHDTAWNPVLPKISKFPQTKAYFSGKKTFNASYRTFFYENLGLVYNLFSKIVDPIERLYS